MRKKQHLEELLKSLEGRGYPAYKSIKGEYQFSNPNFQLIIDKVQSDPFAPPSKIRIRIPQTVAQFPPSLYSSPIRNVALCDYLHRQAAETLKKFSQRRGSGKSGLIAIANIGQEVLRRSSILIDSQWLEVRLVVGLPASGRRILGFEALELLCEDIPEIVKECFLYKALNHRQATLHVETVEDAEYIRQQLPQRKLVAFVANGAILPRDSGVSSLPLRGEEVVSFESPPSLEVEFECPNRGKIRGMGIPEGVTLIVGGGYHGKSTLLRALELGVYNHIPGDGREFVVTIPTAVKIRAEDGRSITGVDISPFINNLPQGKSTTNFHTTNASGSTSQSANIIEALEAGCRLLLIDEDTSATNFMIRDARMRQLVTREPITPFIDKIRLLYRDYGVSTILVMGGSGDYLDVADLVIAMDCFQPIDVTEKAKQIIKQFPQPHPSSLPSHFGKVSQRIINPDSISARRGRKEVKIQIRDLTGIEFGEENIDLSCVEQLVDPCQLRAIALAILYAQETYLRQKKPLAQVLELVMKDINTRGLDILTDTPQGDLAMFRGFELAAAINRLRSLEVFSSQ